MKAHPVGFQMPEQVVCFLQERREAEANREGDNMGEGEGEEEADMEIDPEVDPGAPGFVSPEAALPAMDEGPVKKAPRKRPAKLDDTETAELEKAIQPAAADDSEFDKDVMQNRRLSSLVESIGDCPTCFLGLAPSKILETREKTGHQIKGVRGWYKRSWFPNSILNYIYLCMVHVWLDLNQTLSTVVSHHWFCPDAAGPTVTEQDHRQKQYSSN